jgi:aspartate racemase
MKTLGIIGGIGPESTIDYYRTIIEICTTREPLDGYPPLLINSINLKKMFAFVEANDLSGLTEYLLREIGKLDRAGVDFALLGSNMSHLVFDDVRTASPIPLLSIVEATSQAATKRGLNRLALFGTRFTMRAPFYPDVFSRSGITIVTPCEDDQDYIHEKYVGELLKNIFLPETRAGLLEIVDRLKKKSGIDGVILGGTELPLILRDPNHAGIPFLNTTRIHAEAAVDQMFS